VRTTGTLTAPTITQTSVDGFEAIVLSAAQLEATFVPAAGMLGASLRHDGEELLDRSVAIGDYVENGKTTGIPLLHPWANRLAADHYAACGREVDLPAGLNRDDNGLAIHGVLPRAFAVGETSTADGAAALSASLDFADEAFPFPHRLTQHVRLEPGRLAIETVVEATGDVEVPVSFGFHPYLHLPGAPRAQWTVSLPMRRHLIVDERLIPTGEGEHESACEFILGSTTFDDGYDGLAAEPSFSVRAAGRELCVRLLSGYGAAQVYAPPGRDVICFEPMTAPTNALVSGWSLPHVAPGDAYHALFEIQVLRATA
jgi:aldose 1-epimerase